MTEISVSKITNIVTWKIDNNSYKRALTAIRKVASEWNRATSKVNNPMAQGRTIGGGGRGSPRTPRVNPADRAQEVITAGNIRRQSMYGTGGASSMAGTINSLNAQLKSGAISLQVYRQQVAAVEREFRRAQASATTFGGTLKDIRTGLIALTAGNVLFTGGRSIMQTGQMFQGVESMMGVTSASVEETADKMKYAREEAYRLGLDMKTTAEGYAQLGIGTKHFMNDMQTRELFTGFSEYAKVAGVDAFRFEKSLLGLIQVGNKGQLMAEDVKGQIFENLIGSQEAFLNVANLLEGKEGAMALDVFLDKMQKGELLAKDFLPLLGKYWSDFARSGGKLDKVLNNNQTAMMRLSNTFKNFQNAFFQGGFENVLTKTFNLSAQALRDNEGLAKKLGQAFKAVADNILDGLTLLIDFGTILRIEIIDPILNQIPQGMKNWLADWAAIGAAVLIATGLFRGLYKVIKMIFGMGSLTKSLGMGAGAGSTAGGAAAGAGAVGASRLLGGVPLAIGSASLYGIHEFGQWMAQWQQDLINSLFNDKPQMRTDMRPSLQYNPSLMGLGGRSEYVTKDKALTVDVNVNTNGIKDLINVQIKDEQQKILNQIYPEQ